MKIVDGDKVECDRCESVFPIEDVSLLEKETNRDYERVLCEECLGRRRSAEGYTPVGTSVISPGEPRGGEPVPVAVRDAPSRPERVRVDRLDDGFVGAVAGVRGVLGDDTPLVGPVGVGPVGRDCDDDESFPRLAIADDRARFERVSVTEVRAAGVERTNVSAPQTAQAPIRWSGRDGPRGHLHRNAAEVLAARAADRVVRAGTGAGVKRNHVGAAVGLDDVAPVAKRADRHLFRDGARGSVVVLAGRRRWRRRGRLSRRGRFAGC